MYVAVRIGGRLGVFFETLRALQKFHFSVKQIFALFPATGPAFPGAAGHRGRFAPSHSFRHSFSERTVVGRLPHAGHCAGSWGEESRPKALLAWGSHPG